MSRSLRILQVLSASTNASVPRNTVWMRNLHDPLVQMGHEVVLLPAEEGSRAMATLAEKSAAYP